MTSNPAMRYSATAVWEANTAIARIMSFVTNVIKESRNRALTGKFVFRNCGKHFSAGI